MLRPRSQRLSSLAALVLFLTMTSAAAASDEPGFCSHSLDLIAQSESGFAALQGETSRGPGLYEAALGLPEDAACEILEDAEKSSYRCLWSYPRGDAESRETFQHLVTEMRECIGDRAEETQDRSVNHPDFYASHVFSLSGSLVSVSLKDKSQPLRSFLSIRIDAVPSAE